MALFSHRSQLWFQMDPSTMRSGAFHGTLTLDGTPQPIIGVLASERGVAFLTREPITKKEFDLRFTLGKRDIPARVKIVGNDSMDYKGRRTLRVFCEFVGIKADDWDTVVRYVKNVPEPSENAPTTVIQDEDFRSLPTAVQKSIVDELVRRRRLAQPEPGRVPLMRFRIVSNRQSPSGGTWQEVVVHSRIVIDHEARQFDSRFRIDDDGRVEAL